jgi:hypothetical protein
MQQAVQTLSRIRTEANRIPSVINGLNALLGNLGQRGV